MKGRDFLIFGGTGLQGRICAKDLLESGYSVILAGRDASGIKDLLKNKNADFVHVDLRNQSSIEKTIVDSGCQVVINCAELVFNVPIMRACLKTNKHLTDLGGLQKVTKEQFKLDKQFKEKDLICLTGCGSTPGIANVMASYLVEKFDSVESIFLGFAWDSNIKQFVVPYSMQSIFDEFTQEPIVLLNGKFYKHNRMECKGKFNFKNIGLQETYCIVHSEVYTFAKYFKKKGLKNVFYMAGFPQHSFSVIKNLMDLGFSSEDEIDFHGQKIKPLDFTNRLLRKLKIPKGYKEVEDLWIKIIGKKNGKIVEHRMDCLIETSKGWESAGSNVDTGRTISIMSQMIKKGLIKNRGVCAPEVVVPQKEFFKELSDRKMFLFLDDKKIN